MTTWALERERATETFGASPSPNDERDIAATFAEHPAAIITEISRLGAAYAAGKVHTPWRALHSKLSKIATDEQQVSLTADHRVRLAENWVRNAGIHCPDWPNVQDELFGSRGLLAGLEPQFSDQMRALWTAERPRGEATEHALAQRGQRWRQAHE